MGAETINCRYAFSLDQIIVGTLEGRVLVIDPGRDVENRQEMAVIVEKQLNTPVLQVGVGKFLSNYDTPLIATLHPRALAYHRLVAGEQHVAIMGVCVVK